MKILFYISNLETSGGAERALIGLANWFSNNNDISIVVEHGQRSQVAYQINHHIQYIDLNEHRIKFPIKKISLLLTIKKEIQNIDPDIIISFLALSNIRLLASGIGKQYPVIVCERNDPRSDPKSAKKRKQRDKLYKRAHRIIVQTQEVRDYFLKLNYKHIDVIPNFVNTIPYFESKKEKIIVNVGRLSEQKNQKWLIDSFMHSQLSKRGYQLVIYGDGDLKEELEQYINENKANGYIFIHGTIPNLLEEINKASCFVLPSLYEGMPNALMEAMSMRLPCISTDCPCGGPRSLIKNGVNGVLIEINDQNQFIKALKRIIEDKEYANRISQEAFQIRKTHSINKISKMWEKSIKATLKNRTEKGKKYVR